MCETASGNRGAAAMHRTHTTNPIVKSTLRYHTARHEKSDNQPASTGRTPTPTAPPTESIPAVSVILPTYNERDSAPNVINAVQQELPDAEIVVIDDSTDDTPTVLRNHYGGDDRVRVRHRDHRTGLASAVKDGLEQAQGDIAVVMDADGQHPPAAVKRLVNAITDGADLAVGTRHAADGTITADWPRSRRLVSYGAMWLAAWQLPICRRLSDPMSGLFAVPTQPVQRVLPRIRPRGYKILLELLARLDIDRVAEVPYEFAPRDSGESALSAGEYVRFLRHVFRLGVPARMTASPREVSVYA